MGCGCVERGDRWGEKLEEAGHPRAGAAMRKLPRITDKVQKSVVRGVQRTIQVVPFDRPPVEAQADETDGPARLSGIQVRGHPDQVARIQERIARAERERPRRTVVRGGPRS